MSSTTPNNRYHLGNARYANCRLNLQYHLILRQLKNEILHPRIVNALPKDLKTPDLRIADVCCGTGMWLIDVARVTDDSAELHGFDINTSNLPNTVWTPKIKLHQYNIFEAPPSHFKGTFDIVNISLVLAFVSDALFDSVITNLLALLKPNGWLQWTEIDPLNSGVFAPTPTASSKQMNQVLRGTWDLIRQPYPTWIPKLDSVFASHPGFEEGSIACTRPEPDLSLVRAWTEVLFMGTDEFFETFGDISPSSKTEEGQKRVDELKTIVNGAWSEFLEGGVGHWMQITRVVGKKQAK